MHGRILLMLTQRPNCACSLAGRESEQDVFSHRVLATEAVPAEKNESFLNVRHPSLVIGVGTQRNWLSYNSQAMGLQLQPMTGKLTAPGAATVTGSWALGQASRCSAVALVSGPSVCPEWGPLEAAMGPLTLSLSPSTCRPCTNTGVQKG